ASHLRVSVQQSRSNLLTVRRKHADVITSHHTNFLAVRTFLAPDVGYLLYAIQHFSQLHIVNLASDSILIRMLHSVILRAILGIKFSPVVGNFIDDVVL